MKTASAGSERTVRMRRVTGQPLATGGYGTTDVCLAMFYFILMNLNVNKHAAQV